jgi:hypothetical protein
MAGSTQRKLTNDREAAMKEWMRVMVGAVLPMAFVGVVHAAPCAGFTDVEDTSGFCTSVAWMKNRAITLGCDATHYCPADFVRRDQMAAFLYRLGFQNAFLKGGNAFGGDAVLGTTDGFDLVLTANNAQALRLQPGGGVSPNVYGGHAGNGGSAFADGQTIGGGGREGSTCWNPITFNFTRDCNNIIANVDWATIGGGLANTVNGNEATVGGGSSNSALANKSTVSGGFNNVAGQVNAVVAGGENNRASSVASIVGGGTNNTASNANAVVAGGESNLASGQFAVVAGGYQNQATALQGTVAGGAQNQANGVAGSTVGGGFNNVASGQDATIPGGISNWAPADRSFAAGTRAKATHRGCFTWADSTNLDFFCDYDDAFAVRSLGGVYFATEVNPSTGAMTGGCTLFLAQFGWSCSSDRNLKDVHEAVDGEAVLARLAAMPLYYWSARRDERKVRHVGPMAQDFMTAFAVGHDDRYIGSQDIDGVALAAIQGLNAKLEAQARAHDAQLAARDAEIARLRDAVVALQASRDDVATLKAAMAELLRERATATVAPVVFRH